ncbi:MAG: hypothetical protein LQ351_003580 [Letrouitia transgressa]|nr:MAG: hypothetical protein LQ351_003580 [Letrouitia transgressa]
MSTFDVEALLDSAAAEAASAQEAGRERKDNNIRPKSDRHDHRERDRRRDDSRDRDRGRRRRDKEGSGDISLTSPSSPRGKRTRSRGGRDSGDLDDRYRASGGDYYRGGGRPRSRSRSPDDRYYRPHGRSHRDGNDRYRGRSPMRPDRHYGRKRSLTPKKLRSKSPTPQPTEDERDRRTVFVQQLAARLRTKELIQFFEKVGPVKEAQIVKDRVSGRSKGVGYVEFKEEESVPKAIQLTGQKLLGIPIIAQLTEAEKNRQAKTSDSHGSNPTSIPFHRLYVGNIHFSITEEDLTNVFEPFGELEFVQLQKEEQGRSRGYGFVQFRDPSQAREALEKMNGFDLAGRPIRVGLGNDKFTPESTATLLQRFQGQELQRNFQGSAFSGHGGRGAYAGGSGGAFDRASGDRSGAGASALDDTDVAGVNFNNYSRDALMRKLARTDDPNPAEDKRKAQKAKPLPVSVNQASRCILLRNMFDPAKETGENWVKELEEDVRIECSKKYGKVVHVALDQHTAGDVYLKFEKVQGGENAIKGLNGRFFGGQQISAQPVVDAVYRSLFTNAANL